jgi:hypothetical protein
MSLETWLGVAVTVVVMPSIGYVMNLGKRVANVEKTAAVIERDQKWLMQSMAKQEGSVAEIKKETLEQSGKLDIVVKLLTAKK